MSSAGRRSRYACLLLLAGGPSLAATYHVRVDGGDHLQCDGQADAPYPGNGEGIACAWRHPFVALPPHGTPRIAGGDTLIVHAGEYRMGVGAPGADACEGGDSTECIMAPLPSGPSPAQPTRMLGNGASDQCAGPRPQLWASEGARTVLSLEGSSNVEVACLEITDHSGCIKGHNRVGGAGGETDRCQTGGKPWGDWGEYGVYASDSSHVVLRDLDVHGMAVNGVRAGRLRDWTVLRVMIRANGWAGWDGDIGSGGVEPSGNSGRLVFRSGEIAWNGCGERYPGGEVFGCWAQQQGGYGDGLGTARSGGDWVFEDMHVHHNTSDGLDLLYMDGSGSVTIRRTRAEANAGNQIKVAGPSLIENTIAVGHCSYFSGMASASLGDGDHCRAMGNTLSMTLTDGAAAVVRHTTLAGEGDCLLLTLGGDANARVDIQNNAFIGGVEWKAKSGASHDGVCGHFSADGRAQVVYGRNLFWQVKANQCPAGSICGIDPMLTQASLPAFDAMPRAGSPLIDAGVPLSQVVDDVDQRPRPVGDAVDIGAIEWPGSLASDH